MTALVDEARRVLVAARARAADHPVVGDLVAAEARLDEPLRIAVAGRVKAGKSTLVNAMVGELIAPTDARECTRVVTWYRDGVTYRVEGVTVGGNREPMRYDRNGGALEIDLGDRLAEQLRCIEVTWPSTRLREMTLVDTPGIDSLSVGVSARAEDYLSGGEERLAPTDAVLYLLRHVHVSDLRFLEAFHDDGMGSANPMHSIGILSRADEIGAARPDALASADRIAGRWRTDRRLGALVQTVVPVAGLLAEAASTLRQAEFDALAAIAGADPSLVEELLVTVDRFAASSAPVGVTDTERRVLLERLGLFGCRLAIGAIRSGECSHAASLADRLLHESGLPRLRTELAERFGRRSDVLKARHALFAARHAAQVLHDHALARDVEQIVDGAHEFAELRVLNALRRDPMGFTAARVDAAQRLLGESGMAITARAGLDEDAEAADVRASLTDLLAMWQDQAEHPLASTDRSAAARVLVRTCEGLLVAVAPPDRALSEP